MKCKHHPSRQAEYFCSSCGIPLCQDCAEEARPEEYYCFQCAMLHSISEVGTSIKDKREKKHEKTLEKKKEWGPFQYFMIVASALIVVMWGVILFGSQKAPEGVGDIAKNARVFMFMVDATIKRYAHYEGNKYPEQLLDLVPKYLQLKDENLFHLNKLSYQRDPKVGYYLSLANPKPGTMNINISSKGIQYKPLPEEGV